MSTPDSENTGSEGGNISFEEPMEMLDLIEKLKKCRAIEHIICPDTSVLLHMVQLRKEPGKEKPFIFHLDHYISQLDKWLEQMEQCNKLLGDDSVAWVVPEQVRREFIKNHSLRENKDSRIQSFKERLIYNGKIALGKMINNINNRLEDQISRLEKLVRENQKEIIRKILVLKENSTGYGRSSDPIHDAWARVHSYKFPNNRTQQMKDTVILLHLRRLYLLGHNRNRKPPNDAHTLYSFPNIYFWTFDNFDGALNEKSSKFYIKLKENDTKEGGRGSAGTKGKYIGIKDDLSSILSSSNTPNST
jgi:hypothetical protein